MPIRKISPRRRPEVEFDGKLVSQLQISRPHALSERQRLRLSMGGILVSVSNCSARTREG
jgi:hypothetical protein